MIEEGREAMPAQRSSSEAEQDSVQSQKVAARSRFGLGTIGGRLLIAFVVMTLSPLVQSRWAGNRGNNG
jgi:hypothetical protein